MSGSPFHDDDDLRALLELLAPEMFRPRTWLIVAACLAVPAAVLIFA